MQLQLLCIKIKDGLYIANKVPAQDLEFMLTNKFAYVLNCTSQIPNYFQSMGNIKYYKLKYDRHKHKLWGQTFKKLNKIMKFIQQSEQNAQCCLIHSNQGDNRCCAIAIAFLMKKFLWSLDKTLVYLKSKKVQMKLSTQYLNQLKQLEQVLKLDHMLSLDFSSVALNDEELIMANTYHNTVQIKYEQNKKQKGERHIQWKDRIQKQLAKQRKKELQNTKDSKNSKNLKSQKELDVKNQIKQKKKKNQILPKSIAILQKNNIENKKDKDIEQQIVKLITDKIKQSKNPTLQEQSTQIKKLPVYNLTVNNYINPNIQIFSKEKSLKQNRPLSSGADRKNLKKIKQQQQIHTLDNNSQEQIKINRTFSQKQHRTIILKEKPKNVGTDNSLMKSLMGFQQDIRKGDKKGDIINKYRSTNFESQKYRLQSPKILLPIKKLEKSMSFQTRIKK